MVRVCQPRFYAVGTRFVSWSLFWVPKVNSKALRSLWVCILSTFHVLVLASDGLTNVKSIIELDDPLLNELTEPLLSSTTFSLAIDSRSIRPLLLVFWLPHSTAHALKSPPITTGVLPEQSINKISSMFSNSSILAFGGRSSCICGSHLF